MGNYQDGRSLQLRSYLKLCEAHHLQANPQIDKSPNPQQRIHIESKLC